MLSFHPRLCQSCVAYLFVSVTMISRSSFIPVTVWNMPKGVKPWSRSTSTSASKVLSFFVIGFSLSLYFHSLVVLFFSSLFCLCLVGHCPFSSLYYSRQTEHWPVVFFLFVSSLIIELYFRFLVFLGRVTVGGWVDLDDWSEVCLVTTAVGEW